MKNRWWFLGYLLTFGYYSIWFFQPDIRSFPFDNLWATSILYFLWMFSLLLLDKFELNSARYRWTPSYWWVLFFPVYLFRRYVLTKQLYVLAAAIILFVYFLIGTSIHIGLISYDWFH